VPAAACIDALSTDGHGAGCQGRKGHSSREEGIDVLEIEWRRSSISRATDQLPHSMPEHFPIGLPRLRAVGMQRARSRHVARGF